MMQMTSKHVQKYNTTLLYAKCAFIGIMNERFSQDVQNKQYQKTTYSELMRRLGEKSVSSREFRNMAGNVLIFSEVTT
jgi:hypothetical protein